MLKNRKFSNNTFREIIFCLFLVISSLFFRGYRISSAPPSASLDEVSIGYNAYSVLKTGKDEYGKTFPILLRAYDDYRPALYVYFVIPFVRLLGLTVTAVRMPSVLASVGTVVLVYFLSLEVTRKNMLMSAIAALLMVISPWHIYISRLGNEVNIGLFFFVAGAYCLIRAINQQKSTVSFLAASLFLGVSLYTYQSYKIFLPLFLTAVGLLYWKDCIKYKRSIIFSGIIGLCISLPIVYATLSPGALLRLKGTSAFLYNPLYPQAEVYRTEARQKKDIIGMIRYSQIATTGYIFTTNYLLHFAPSWLFFGGVHDIHKSPGIGLMYWWEGICILFGGLFLLGKREKRIGIFVVSWLFLSPIPAALTTQAPHAMRTYPALPILSILAAMGMVWFIYIFRQRVLRLLLIIIFVMLYVTSANSFAHSYFYDFPRYQSDSFQYGLSQAIQYVLAHQSSYERIVFSNQDSLQQSYMFFLFYSAYNPSQYLNEGGTYSGGFAEPHTFGKYEFRIIRWQEEEKRSENTLYVGNVREFPPNWPTRFTGSNLDGTIVIKAVTRP